MKTKELIISIIIESIATTVITFILNRNNMDTISYFVVLLGIIIIGLTLFYYFFDKKIGALDKKIKELNEGSDKKIKALDKYPDNTNDSIYDIIELHEILNKRKMNYLYSMLKNSNLYKTPPNNFLTDYERKNILKLSDKRQKEINDAMNDFNEDKDK